ncbi:hypothetical protein EDB85DRAFT_2157659 [Lactarius pseudohatsudake]|nr:hypothetical protein EDB85DRAFT_2157659 [Lactarius pseudohatsudake]
MVCDVHDDESSSEESEDTDDDNDEDGEREGNEDIDNEIDGEQEGTDRSLIDDCEKFAELGEIDTNDLSLEPISVAERREACVLLSKCNVTTGVKSDLDTEGRSRLSRPSIDPGAGSVDAETAGNEGPCPSVSLNDPVYIEVENSPVSSDPLPLEDAGDGVDPDDLSDGSDDLVEQTALQRFASALQEAQKVAIQLERDQAHQRRKTSKTYRGNSRTTFFRREKARKVLASEGFLDIRSFMVLKEKEREERKRSSDTPVITDRMTSGGSVVNEEDEGDDSDIVVLPGPADRARYRGDDSDEGSDVAGDVEGPGPVALSRHEHAEEEEESDGEAEGSRAGRNKSPLYSARSGWADMSSGAAENRGPGRVAFTRREYAEEEESSEGSEGPKEFLAANYEHKTDGGVEWDLPGPERTPTVQSERSDVDVDKDDLHDSHGATSQGASDWVSDNGDNGNTSDEDGGEFNVRLGGHQRALDAALDEICRGRIPMDLGPFELTRTDRALNVWDDRENLRKACVPLLVMSKSPNFDALLRARLTGMVGVLNLYLDPALQYTWRRASELVSKIEGKGANRARMLRRWILEFIRSGDIPQPQYRRSHQTVLNDEDVSQFIQLQIMAHTKGRYIAASDIVEVVAGDEVQEKFSRSGIIKPTISESTACRWLLKLNWRFGPTQNGMYLDGHERPDVVAYQEGFIGRWKEYEKRFHLWDNDGNLLPLPNGFPVWHVPGANGRFRLILVTHDESTFFQNDLRKTHWTHGSNKPTPRQKGDGQSIMVSDFLTSEWGRLCDDPDDTGLDGEKPQSVQFPSIRPI